MKKLIYCLTFLFSAITFSQGLNNEQYKFDEADFENIAESFLGIQTYKFYVNAKFNDEYDIIIEEFKDKKQVNTKKIISKMIKDFGMNPVNKKFGDSFIRCYVQDNIKKSKSVKIVFKYLNLTIPQEFKDLELKYLQTRAFTNIPTNVDKKTPVLAIYGNKDGTMIGCPGDAKPEDIVKLYDWVTIIYFDKLKKDKK